MVELGLECNSVVYCYVSNIPAKGKVFPGTKFCRIQCIERGMKDGSGNTENRKGS